MPLNDLLKLIDWQVRKVAIKGSFVWFHPEIIIMTANDHPKDWYTWEPSEKHPKGRLSKRKALRRRIDLVYEWNEKKIDFDLHEGKEAIARYWPIDEQVLKKVDNTPPKNLKRKAPVVDIDDPEMVHSDYYKKQKLIMLANITPVIIDQPDEEPTQDPDDDNQPILAHTAIIAEPVEDMELEQTYKDMLADVLGPLVQKETDEPTVRGIPHSIFYENLL